MGVSTSQNKQTDMRILQGEVLSVLFFLVAINDILIKLGNGVDISLFVDDLALYITIRNQRVAVRALQRVTNKFEVWAAEKRLTFSTSKTVNMVFRKRRKRSRKQWKLQ